MNLKRVTINQISINFRFKEVYPDLLLLHTARSFSNMIRFTLIFTKIEMILNHL
jgi:hypothetical protein